MLLLTLENFLLRELVYLELQIIMSLPNCAKRESSEQCDSLFHAESQNVQRSISRNTAFVRHKIDNKKRNKYIFS